VPDTLFSDLKIGLEELTHLPSQKRDGHWSGSDQFNIFPVLLGVFC